MLQHFAALNLRQAFLNLAHKPFVVPDQPLDRLFHERLRVSPLLRGDAVQLRLKLRREFHFHAVSVFHFANKVYTVAARSGSSGRASLPFVTPVYAVRASCRRVSPHPTQLNLRWIYL